MQPESPSPTPAADATPTGLARSFVVRTPRRTWAVPLLIAINTIVFIAMVLNGAAWNEPGLQDLLHFGANHGPYVAHGDWWRLVTCAFVHIGFVHFMVNMASLFALRIVESFYGSGAFLLLYLMSAIGASACSVLWHPSEVSAGASGAIFGMAGALLTFFLTNRQAIPDLFFRPVMRNLIVLIALNLTYGALWPNVDNMAHAGGLVTGLIVGRALDRDPQGSARLDARRLLRATIPAILIGLLCLLVPWRAVSAKDIRIDIAAENAQRQLHLGRDEEALRMTEEGLALEPTSPELLAVRAKIRLRRGEPRDALADLDTLLYQEPGDATSRYLRARLLWILGRTGDALEDARLLVGQAPSDMRFLLLLGELEWVQDSWREAAVAFGTIARQKAESAMQGQLLLWIARWRMGEEEQATKELRHFLATPRLGEDNELDTSIGGLLAGQARLEDLIARFDRQNAPRGDLRRLYYFAALWRLQKGDSAQAREFLNRALEGGAGVDEIWLLARHELDRLEKH